MGLPGLIGMCIRFIFVFHCSFKKKNEATKKDMDAEKAKDGQVGLIGLIVIIIAMGVTYELMH